MIIRDITQYVNMTEHFSQENMFYFHIREFSKQTIAHSIV